MQILNRTHSKGNVPKTTTQRSHNHHNKVIYEYQNKRHAQEHNRETLKTTKHIKITRSPKKNAQERQSTNTTKRKAKTPRNEQQTRHNTLHKIQHAST